MSKRTRFYILWTLVLVFILAGLGAVFYSQGWRITLEGFRLQKVGAIYIRSFPSSAQIFLNGEPVKNSSWLLQNGTLISNLFPKEYTIELKAPGFLTWKETVHVEPMKVSEAKYAVLIPETPSLSMSLGSNISNFWLLGERLATQNSSGTIVYRDQIVPGESVIAQTADSRRMFTQDGQSGSFLYTDFGGSTTTDITALLKRTGYSRQPLELIPDEGDNSKIYIREQKRVLMLDTSRPRVSVLNSTEDSSRSTSKLVGGEIAPSRFYVAWTLYDPSQDVTSIVIYDKFLRTIQANSPLVSGKNIALEWTNGNLLGILQKDGGFYTYNPGDSRVQPIASTVKEFEFSYDGKMVATIEDEALEVISFADKRDYRRFRLPENSSITGTTWYQDDQHLFVEYPDSVGFLDLNDRFLENFQKLSTTSLARYDKSGNTLYFLKEKQIWRIDFPD